MRAAWREFGVLGRLAFVGVLLSGLVAVSLGFLIPETVEEHVIQERVSELERAVETVRAETPGDVFLEDEAALAVFGDEVLRRLLGGDTVRVKLWSLEGLIIWSDEPRLIGRSFEISHHVSDAFAGIVAVERTDIRDPENLFERDFGDLLEFYVPLHGESGDPVAVFEVYQRAAPLQETLSDVRWATWLRIGSGLLVLSLFMGTLTLVTIRGAERRRKESEDLFARSLEVRELERARLVSALHDDVGQPLYGLLFGLENLETADMSPAERAAETRRLGALVRQVDDTLRVEMRRLRTTPLDHQALAASLEQLSGAGTEVVIDTERQVDGLAAEALYRAGREAVNNARKHSGAETIRLQLLETDGHVAVVITDDGTWKPGPPGLGLATVRQLLRGVGGDLEVEPRNGRGTTVTAHVPIEEPE